jgi:hypothetical protein
MDEIALRKLIDKQEGASLEFKRQWYELESPNQRKAESAKGEMIKDVLSLANGNTNVAGEMSFLVIGASNEIDENGHRELFNVVSEKPINRQRILDIVNPWCDPPIEDILCDDVLVDGKQLIVITILPSPHVHETIKKLKTAKVTYDEYTVFVRHAEGVRTASTKERVALQQLKKLRFNETKNVPPVPFGAILGALLVGQLGPQILAKEGDSKEQIRAKTIVSAGIGAFIGGIIGINYSQIKSFPLLWQQTSKRGKFIGVMSVSAFGILYWWVMKYISRKRKQIDE